MRQWRMSTEAMRRFAHAFVKTDEGWFCRLSVQFVGRDGTAVTVTPGATYRRGNLLDGYDICQWLDNWEKHCVAPIGIDLRP